MYLIIPYIPPCANLTLPRCVCTGVHTHALFCSTKRNAFLLLFSLDEETAFVLPFFPALHCIPDNSIDQTHQVCVCVAIDQIHQQQSQFTASTLSSFQAFRSRRSNTAQQQPSLHHRISPNEGTESVP